MHARYGIRLIFFTVPFSWIYTVRAYGILNTTSLISSKLIVEKYQDFFRIRFNPWLTGQNTFLSLFFFNSLHSSRYISNPIDLQLGSVTDNALLLTLKFSFITLKPFTWHSPPPILSSKRFHCVCFFDISAFFCPIVFVSVLFWIWWRIEKVRPKFLWDSFPLQIFIQK